MHSHPSAHGGAPLPGPGAMPAQAPTAQPPPANANPPTHPPVSPIVILFKNHYIE